MDQPTAPEIITRSNVDRESYFNAVKRDECGNITDATEVLEEA